MDEDEVSGMSYLTADDLARPAKDLPLKVLRGLGQMLNKVQCTSGNWETIAEDLGYEYDEIQQFNTMSNARQDVMTPGELMLRDWVQRPVGRTLFVLHSALRQADRLDCVEYLESEIYKRIVCMELIICVRYEDGQMTVHQHVATRADSSLLDSLHSVLEQPVQLKYRLLDHGVSWTRTLAREIKGRQLMLLRKQDSVWMEQDPTIDSSGIDSTVLGDRNFNTTSHGSFANSGVRTSQVSLTSSESRTRQSSCLKTSHISDLRTSQITDLKTANTQSEQIVSGSRCNEPDLIGNMQVLHGRGTEYRSRSQSLQVETVIKTASARLVGLSGHFASCNSLAVCNNLNCSDIKNSASSTQQKINISINEGDSIEDNSAWAAMDCDYNPISEAGAEADSSEYRDFSEYRESSEQEDLSKFKDHTNSKSRVLNEFMDSSEYMDPIENTDSSKQRDPKKFKRRTCSDEYRDLIENSDYSEYRDPRGYCNYEEYRDASEYRDPTTYKDAVEILHDGDYKEPDNNRYTSGGFDTADFPLASRESEQSRVSEKIMKQEVLGGDNTCTIIAEDFLASTEFGQSHLSETEVKQAVSGDDTTDTDKCFDSADYQYAENDLVSSDDSITILKQRICSSDVNHWDDINVDTQAHVEPSDTHLKQITPESVDESNVMCNSNNQYFTNNDNSQLDFDSETYNAHPDFERDGKDLNVDSDMNLSELGLHNEQGAVQDDTGNGLIKGSGDTRTYLDFNKYYQGNVHVNGSEMGGDEMRSDPVNECEKGRSHQTFTRIQHRPPRRYISEAPGEMSIVQRGQQLYPYESLQRGMSCPSDFVYEKSLMFSEEHHDMVTIADVFSPVTDESKMKDFEIADRGTLQASSSSSTGSVDSTVPKRHSLPVVRPCQNVRKIKHQRHTIQDCDKMVRFGEHFEQELSRPMQDSPQLPPRGRRSELRTGTLDTCTILGSEMSRSNSNVSMQSASENTRDTRYVCKIVIGGKTSRPPLDGLLADDKLFIHYNTTLQGFPGWSPRETENTIEKTMRDALSSEGYYIIWYIRCRKTLVLSVSYRGSLVNYRVHTKVMTGKLHYYVTQGRYFEHVVQLLQHYQHYGVRAGSVDGDAEYRIKLGCPILVQYERRPAVSV